jgi:hypothetical protein
MEDGIIDRIGDAVASASYVVHADRTDRVWIGFWGGGLSAYDRGQVASFAVESGHPQSSVSDIFEDRTGRIWVATEQQLALIDGQRLRTFESNGFPRNGVVSMVEDAAGDFWIGLGPSLMRIDPREFDLAAADPRHQLRFRLYGSEDGLPGTVRPARRAERGELPVANCCRHVESVSPSWIERASRSSTTALLRVDRVMAEPGGESRCRPRAMPRRPRGWSSTTHC